MFPELPAVETNVTVLRNMKHNEGGKYRKADAIFHNAVLPAAALFSVGADSSESQDQQTVASTLPLQTPEFNIYFIFYVAGGGNSFRM
jgi:hypothetical protein